MEFDKVIRERCSTRKFSDKLLEQDKLDKILEAGRIAPTAVNKQPFKVYVVRSKDGLSKIDKATRYRYGAPVVLMILGNKNEAYSRDDYSSYEMDSTIVATHMMLEATNIGVSNIWIKLYDSDVLKNEFNLPDNLIPVCLMPIGYRADDCPQSMHHNTRKSIDKIVEYR